jgi:aspartyl protease family protein
VSEGGEHAVSFLYLVLCLVLVLSALTVRRIPIALGLKMFAGWVLIFLAAFILFTLKDDFLALGRHLLAESGGEPQTAAGRSELRIRKSLDGHFWVSAKINGETARFLIDSGATTTSISADVARRAGIATAGGFPVMVQTANGVVPVQRGRVETLEVGSIRRSNFAVHVSEAFGPMNVLGMNFLSSLSGWGVEGQFLVLRP